MDEKYEYLINIVNITIYCIVFNDLIFFLKIKINVSIQRKKLFHEKIFKLRILLQKLIVMQLIIRKVLPIDKIII